MTFLRFVFYSIFLFSTVLLSSAQKTTGHKSPYVVMLSLDGFRWDYTQFVETPNFDRMAKMGVKAQSLQPSFPTKTFPNHYSIATGLYPGNHGLVNNSFYDADKDLTYKVSDRKTVEDKDFYGGEPIWNTAEKQGVKAACFYWVGSEAPVQGMRPSIWKKYDQSVSWNKRANKVIDWLRLPEEERPHLILWYLHEPDAVGHKFGPQSVELKNMIKRLDKFVGRFLMKLETLPFANEINVIITSDHGMGATSSKRYVNLEKYVSNDDFVYTIPGNPVVFLQPQKSKTQEVYSKLKSVEHISVTRDGERPAYWHYNYHPRIADIVVVADSAWSVGFGEASYDWSGGAHGYDPLNIDMHAIFYAFGPAFKTKYVQPTFENVDIYSLIAKILNLRPANTNGKLQHVQSMLKE